MQQWSGSFHTHGYDCLENQKQGSPVLAVCILQYPKPHFLVEQVVYFTAVDIKEASTDCQILLGVLWQGIQTEISVAVNKKKKKN